MMKKTLLLLVSGITLASMATVDAKDCKRKKRCEREEKRCEKVAKPCETLCCTEPTQEIHGVLCKAVRGHEYIPQDKKCCKKYKPCKPKICTREIPQPDRMEKVWECREVCVPVPPVIEYYVEEQPDECCEEWVECPPKCVECIKYIPVELNVKPPCVPAVDTCKAGGSCTREARMEMQENNNMEMEME